MSANRRRTIDVTGRSAERRISSMTPEEKTALLLSDGARWDNYYKVLERDGTVISTGPLYLTIEEPCHDNAICEATNAIAVLTAAGLNPYHEQLLEARARIAELEAANAVLTADRDSWRRVLETMTAERDELRRDAKAYREIVHEWMARVDVLAEEWRKSKDDRDCEIAAQGSDCAVEFFKMVCRKSEVGRGLLDRAEAAKESSDD